MKKTNAPEESLEKKLWKTVDKLRKNLCFGSQRRDKITIISLFRKFRYIMRTLLSLFLLILSYSITIYPQWTKVSMDNKTVRSILIDNDKYLAGTEDFGLYISADKGNSWLQVQNGPYSPISVYSIIKAGSYYVCTSNLVGTIVYRSTDALNWQPVYTKNDQGFPKALCYYNGNVFYGTAPSGAFRSTDLGLTWGHSGAFPFTATFITSFIANDQYIFAGTETNCWGVWRSSDNGLTWDTCSNGLPKYENNVYRDIQSMLSYKNMIFAGTPNTGIYVSTDNGNYWSPSNNGLPATIANVNSLINIGDMIVAACTYGIFKSIDDGKSWNAITGYQSGLYPVSLASDGLYLFVGMVDNGIWRLPLSELTGINEKINIPDFNLSQNYPNPFNPSTLISYSLPSASDIKLIAYNTLGQSIKVLESGYKPAGNYSITFNASDLPSGIYFYKLEAGKVSQIKKMLLLK